ncbi:MAG TPA: hypothetical protein VGX28_13915 [Frankiaceae bacterium]|jgi:hypothetical protein|nr:hypothetical protein [Frankiaceae bacterium]
MNESTPQAGIPGLFSDPADFADAFAQALSKLPLAEVENFHRQLAEALRQTQSRKDAMPFVQLALGMVCDERLATNDEFKRAVKEVEELDTQSPPEAIDHRALIAELRAG